MGGITLYVHTSEYTLHPPVIYTAIAFSAGLVDRESDKTNFYYTQLVPSKLAAACNTHVH